MQNLTFGGNQGLSSSSQLDRRHRSRTRSRGSTTRTSIASSSRPKRQYNGSTQNLASNLLGTFTFNSLEDLEAGRPASFNRTLTARQRSTGQFAGSLSIGDSYRRSQDLQIQYGLRVDVGAFHCERRRTTRRSMRRSADATIMCRRRSRSARASDSRGRSATVNEIASFFGQARAPRAVMRGGIGVFTNASSVGSDRLGARQHRPAEWGAADRVRRSGGADGRLGVVRTNPAAIPDRCADGTTGTVFSNDAPNVYAGVAELPSAAQRAVESLVERRDPRLRGSRRTSKARTR